MYLGAPEAMSLSGAKLAELQKRHDEVANEIRAEAGDEQSRAQPLEKLVELLRKELSMLPNSHYQKIHYWRSQDHVLSFSREAQAA